MSHEPVPASQNKAGVEGSPESISFSDLTKYSDLAFKVVQAYLAYHNLPPGGEADSPPIRFHHDTLTLHVKRD